MEQHHLAFHLNNYKLRAEHFSATSHDKSPFDGIGGSLRDELPILVQE